MKCEVLLLLSESFRRSLTFLFGIWEANFSPGYVSFASLQAETKKSQGRRV